MTLGKLEGQLLSNRYQIESLIGQGGMSAVYKGYDPNLRRTVAVKVIHPHLSNNPDFVNRFQEEAAAVARLRHPNIVQVFDFNADSDLYYMIMEFLPGETLQGRLARLNKSSRHLPMQNALTFGAEICEAAEYAHQRGMVHRDIKPANVMLSVDGKAILMDFGIARIVGGSQHTATGAVLGTAMYMAPEQVQGLQADARADIYSLGVTLFEMFSGKPPFEADSAMTLMMMHLNDPVPDLRDVRPDAPEAVLQVIETAMAKNRGDRYPSAQAMAEALRRILAQGGLPAEARPKTQPRPAPAPGETVIEAPAAPPAAQPPRTPPPTPPAGTLIEPAPAAPAARRDLGGTYVEPAQPATPAYRPAQTPPPPAAAFPTSPEQAAYPVRPRRSPWLGFLLILLLIGGLGGGGLVVYQQFFAGGSLPPTAAPATQTQAVPVAALADTPTSAPSATFTPEPTATASPQPTETPTVTPTPTLAPVVIGGADKIAWLQGGDVWAANLDGSQLAQLTTDGSAKTYLRWLPDGSGLSYISGKCIQSVSLEGVASQIACFNNSQYLESFEVSPDGSQVVISVDRQLYLVPFDLAALAGVNSHDDLAGMAACAAYAPYKRNFAHMVRWSGDGSKWAALVLGVLADGRRGDVVQVFSVDRCIPDPLVQVQFPQPHFSFREYDKIPALESITWDGSALFSFHGNTRNDGFGDLHIFNIDTFKALLSVNPIGGKCCYRDPAFSPDGSHLLFAYQDYLQGASSVTRLYYIPFGSIGTGQTYGPLPLPEITDPREKPQPVLRPAGGP